MSERTPTSHRSAFADPATGPADHLSHFEAARPRLLGLAYRILGSRAEAEDAVQDTFLRFQATELATIATPAAWLTTAVTRRAIDMLRAAYRSRVDYVGSWLPEPVETAAHADPETEMDLSSSLSTAFLLMLERLTPKERAAYLLHEIFEIAYAEIAETLEMTEPACRKLVSRARARIGGSEVRYRPPRERQDALLSAFEEAIRTGTPGPLALMLAEDVQLTADGGGKVPAVREDVQGPAVLAFLTERMALWWADYEWRPTDINGARGFVLREAGRTVATVSFGFDGDRISDIFIVRNPDKLANLRDAPIH